MPRSVPSGQAKIITLSACLLIISGEWNNHRCFVVDNSREYGKLALIFGSLHIRVPEVPAPGKGS